MRKGSGVFFLGFTDRLRLKLLRSLLVFGIEIPMSHRLYAVTFGAVVARYLLSRLHLGREASISYGRRRPSPLVRM